MNSRVSRRQPPALQGTNCSGLPSGAASNVPLPLRTQSSARSVYRIDDRHVVMRLGRGSSPRLPATPMELLDKVLDSDDRTRRAKTLMIYAAACVAALILCVGASCGAISVLGGGALATISGLVAGKRIVSRRRRVTSHFTGRQATSHGGVLPFEARQPTHDDRARPDHGG